MHPADKKPLQLLNNLIGINNNRLECYSFAEKETDVAVLKVLFGRLLETSYICREELIHEVYKLGGIPEEGTVPYFEFFKAWVDVKSALTRNDHAAILNSCAYEEGVVLKSYENVLKTGQDAVTRQHQQIFNKQYEVLCADHEKVMNLRDVLVKSI
jgi:uncharacterized protein (TIGR02284 family)